MAKSKYKEEDPKRPTPVTRDGAYVMMLFITLVAVAAGCVLMYLDREEYGDKPVPKETPAPFQLKDLGSKANVPDTSGPVTPPAPPPGGPMGMGPMGMGPMGMGP
jgi:hypothetical protein